MAITMTRRPHDRTRLESHFRFGRNWRSYAAGVGEREIGAAVAGLARLVPDGELADKRFLDIGCGAGLSILAARRLGATTVHGIDLDPESVEAAREVLSRFAADGSWSVEIASVLEVRPEGLGTFDIVYSWGVLHHTGHMWDALAKAAAMVAGDGLLIIALYRRTPFCRLWAEEKKFYAHAPSWVQAVVRGLYRAAFFAGLIATGRRPRDYLANYFSARGMDFAHDVHDWLGGYPYESTRPNEVRGRLAALGFSLEAVHEVAPPLRGLFGSGCDEYVARRAGQESANMNARTKGTVSE